MDEIPKYRKKSKKKPPKKSKHKHVYEPCVFEYHVDVPWSPHAKNKLIGSYCRVCGKIGSMINREKWIQECRTPGGGWFTVWTEKAEAEFDPRTRTIPYFYLTDLWKQKYVLVEGADE